MMTRKQIAKAQAEATEARDRGDMIYAVTLGTIGLNKLQSAWTNEHLNIIAGLGWELLSVIPAPNSLTRGPQTLFTFKRGA